MNARLHELLRNYFDHPSEDGLKKLAEYRVPESEFTDELMDSFPPHERREVYCRIWNCCGHVPSEGFLQHRIEVETDPVCQRSLNLTLRLINLRKRPFGECNRHIHPTLDRGHAFRTLILQHIKNPEDPSSTQSILTLEPDAQDFDDHLLDSLTPEERLDVYPMLLAWCGPAVQKNILERRVLMETDSGCKFAIAVLLRS